MSELLYTQISNSNIKSSRRAWHESLIDYFELLKTMEDKIDLIRASLCSEKNFSPKKLFEYIDKRNKKNITLNDLILVLEENKIIFKEENLRKFIHNFDKDNDFCLDYNEFIGIILPRKNKLLQKNFITLFQYNNNYEINQNIIKFFCDLLIEEMKLIEKCNKIIKEIQEYSGFTPYEAFLDIVNGDGIYINDNNLAHFLMENNVEINEEDSHQLIFRLDKDNDGKISYEEFQNMFLILHKSNKKEKSYNKQNILIDINKENFNDNINPTKNYKIDINYNENNYKKINIFKYNNNINHKNAFSKNGFNSIRKDANLNKNSVLKKDFKIEMNNNTNSNIEQLSYSNLFYDSLESAKNQENSINSNGKVKNNQENNLMPNNNKILYKKNQNNFRNKIEKQKIIDEKLKKIFQIPKNDKLYTPIMKKEKEEEKSKESESPKFSYTKVPLYYDYSTNSNSNINKKGNLFRKCNSSKNISTPYSSNINNEETDYITHDNNIQIYNNININNKSTTEEISNKKNIKSKKNNKIPYSSSRRTEIKNNNIILFNANNSNNNNTHKENCKENKSYNKIKDDKNSSNKKIVNNLFQNIFDEHQKNNNASKDSKIINDINKKNENEKNNNTKNLTKLKKNLKKEQNLQDLILNSPFLEKKEEENKDNINILHNDKNRTPVQILNRNRNRNIKEEILKNYNSTFSKNNKNKNKEEFKDIDIIIEKNNEETKNLDNFDINNYSHNSVISTSLINNPTQTNFDNNFDSNSYFLNNNNDNNNIIHEIDNNNEKNEIKNIEMNKNSENYFTLDGSNNNNFINLNLESNINTGMNNNANLNISENEEKENNYINNINDMNNNNLNNSKNSSDNDDNNENIGKFIKERYNLIKNQKDEYMYNNSSKINFEVTQYERFNNLYNLLYDFLKWELILENIKISLSVREDINTKLLFELFDTKKRNLISISDISKTLKNLGMNNVNSNDIKYIFLQNNKRSKEKLNFNDFCEIVLPNNSEKRKEMNEREINENYKNDITDKTKNIICMLFQKIIEGERSNEFYRNNLAMVPDSSGFDLFNLMKKNYSIGIYKEDIDNFLSSRGKVFYNNETELIMKKLDRNKDGVIDYTEFLTEITPKFMF